MDISVVGGTRVLIVEDEALVRLMLGEMLTELGHEIAAEAPRLDTALRMAAEVEYDLAVLDLNLGNGITLDVAEIVLGRGKAMILSTGYGAAGLDSKYQNCVVLQKPYSQEALGRAVELSLRQIGADKPQAAP